MSAVRSAAPRRRWRRDPAGRRARILAAAAREFAAVGYRRARTSRIAAAARVAEGTVYHQFGSKRGLLVAVGEAYGRGLARAAFGGLGTAPQPGDAAAVVRRIFAYVSDSGGPLQAFLLAADPDEGAAAQDANRATMLRAIEEALRGWAERGLIPPLHPRIAAEIQFGLVESALRDCFLRRGGADRALYEAETARCLSACLGVPLRA